MKGRAAAAAAAAAAARAAAAGPAADAASTRHEKSAQSKTLYRNADDASYKIGTLDT